MIQKKHIFTLIHLIGKQKIIILIMILIGADHERLADCIKEMNGMFSLSYYDFELLRKWFPKHEYVWEKKEFAKAAAAKSGVKQNMGEELLIMNYGDNVLESPCYGMQLDLFKHDYL